MKYCIEFAKSAERQLGKLPTSIQIRLVKKIESLGSDPRPQRVEKLIGREHGYRIRVGDYRVLYRVEDDVLTVLVVAVGHRREVYR
ncbi:MAG TPA: type II toxin-antitoxin system RelE/ParE family toxin [bacterium]|nr:type II toxin-antitoxin system RelE/ParE family toxin [bacterium]